jgi:hypothetical protein
MSHTILIAHYILWGAVMVMAGFTLRAYRGVSVLAVFSLAIALQVGTFCAFAGDFPLLGLTMSGASVERMARALIIVYSLSIVFMAGLLFFRDRRGGRRTVRKVAIPRIWRIIGILLVAGLVAVRLSSAASREVMRHGLDVVGSSRYYDLRVDLIDMNNASSSRLANYFEATARQVLFVMLIIAAIEVAEKASPRRIAFYAVVLGGLCFDGMLTLQKAPVLMALMAGVAPILVAALRSGRTGAVRIALRVGMILLVVVMVSAGLYSLTEGYSVGESLNMVWARVFEIPSSTTLMHFEVYPDYLPHMYWTDLTPVRAFLGNRSLMPGDDPISIEVARALTGQSFNANASMVGEAWACAGYAGVALETVVMAMTCFLLDSMARRAGRTRSLLPLGVYYWLGFPVFGNISIFPIIVQQALWLVPALYCLVLPVRGPKHDDVTGDGPGLESSAPAVAS